MDRTVGVRVGYVRVSTLEQNTERQLDGVALDRVFTDHASGRDTERPELKRLMEFVRDGDTVLVHSIDRLARNLDDLRRIVSDLTARAVRVEFVREGLTFTGDDSPMSTMLLSVMGALAEFERALLRERQREGIAIARAAGKYKGRKRALSPKEIDQLMEVVAYSDLSISQTAKKFGISRTTLYAYCDREQAVRKAASDAAREVAALLPRP